jgi:PAS domain S-box-containing protein
MSNDQTLYVSQEHLDIALNHLRLGFWELDLEQNAMICTPQCKVNVGASLDHNLSYEGLLAAIIPEDREKMQADVMLSMAPGNGVYHSQYRVKHSDGSLHWIEANGKVLYQDDVPYRMVGTTLDITEKKDLEMLKDELLNIATHEIKTPLSVIKGYLQITHAFIERTGNQKFSDISRKTLAATDRIARLVKDMAHPAKGSPDQIKLSKERFDLIELITDIIANAKLISPNHSVMLNHDGAVVLEADKDRISQVLINLLNNAIKFSGGSKSIDLTVEVADKAVQVCIRDRGIGISAVEQHKIFQKYYRSESSKQNIEGSGIGLYLCSEIITRHGGRIWVEQPADGQGSVFIFTLPVING